MIYIVGKPLIFFPNRETRQDYIQGMIQLKMRIHMMIVGTVGAEIVAMAISVPTNTPKEERTKIDAVWNLRPGLRPRSETVVGIKSIAAVNKNPTACVVKHMNATVTN